MFFLRLALAYFYKYSILWLMQAVANKFSCLCDSLILRDFITSLLFIKTITGCLPGFVWKIMILLVVNWMVLFCCSCSPMYMENHQQISKTKNSSIY